MNLKKIDESQKLCEERQSDFNSVDSETQNEIFSTKISKVKELLYKTTTSNGIEKICNSVSNYEKILQNDFRFENTIKYNDFSEQIEIINSSWNNKCHVLEDSDHNYIISKIESSYGIYNNEKLTQALTNVARLNKYNPIKDMLNNLVWDGVDRITTMFSDTLGAENNKYNSNVSKLMLLGAISRIYNPGCKFDYCIILSSENTQGLGKSSLIRKLAMQDRYFTDSLRTLDTDTNTLQLLRGKWLIELGELKALNKCRGGVEGVKQFISTQIDTYRNSYARHSKNYERKCIFVGSTNKGEYLIDDTGNRRFLPIVCATNDNIKAMNRIKYHMYEDTKEIQDYVNQLWAQAMFIFKSGKFKLVLDKENEKHLAELHNNARIYNPMVDEIQHYIDGLPNGEYISIKSVYIDVYNSGIPTRNITREARNEIRSILNSSDVTHVKKIDNTVRTKYGTAKGYKIVKGFEPITQDQEKEIKETFKQSAIDL